MLTSIKPFFLQWQILQIKIGEKHILFLGCTSSTAEEFRPWECREHPVPVVARNLENKKSAKTNLWKLIEIRLGASSDL